jgi:16S rRNA (adenine1518-N6/adenine1519-N6)-dimethyltransferase
MRQRLGQHFLKNKGALRKIALAMEIEKNDIVVEIGPGHGELTEYLLKENPKKVIAIEKDKSLALSLPSSMARRAPEASHKLEIIEGDILKTLPKFHFKYKLVGNIPYYLTGRLLRLLSELENKPELIVLTLQKEVALRITAQPPKMNLLAAIVQFWANPRILGSIKKTSFSPAPKVDSAILKLALKTKKEMESLPPAEEYYKIVKIIFKQPRKTILNNLCYGSGFCKKRLEKELLSIGLDPFSRAGRISIKDVQKISGAL